VAELAITVIGADRPGIAAAVTDALAEIGANLEDTSRAEALAAFLDDWEAEHGALTAEELARAADEAGLAEAVRDEAGGLTAVVLDAGAFVAVDRGDRAMAARLRMANRGGLGLRARRSADGPGVAAGQQSLEVAGAGLASRGGDLLGEQVVVGRSVDVAEHSDRRRVRQAGQRERGGGVGGRWRLPIENAMVPMWLYRKAYPSCPTWPFMLPRPCGAAGTSCLPNQKVSWRFGT
jgi:hypothetical protein